MKKVVIIGASSGGKKMFHFIKQFSGYEICLFVDNFPKQSSYLGLEVIQADQFLKRADRKQYYYCIGSTYWEEIYSQLTDAGIKEDHIYSKLDILLENRSWFFGQFQNAEEKIFDDGNNCRKPIFVFDLLNGFGLGGVENWSYILARAFVKENNVILLGNDSQGNAPEEFSENSVFLIRIPIIYLLIPLLPDPL
jgi:hypothetical protein